MTATIINHPLFSAVSDINLPERPLDMILADHYRQRLISQDLLDLARDTDIPSAPERARFIQAYLVDELVHHEAFEEEDLSPMLRRQCRPSDNIDKILGIQVWDRFVDKDNTNAIMSGLVRLVQRRPLEDADHFGRDVQRFCKKLNDHILWENRVVIPLARRCLNPDDLAELSESWADRRRRRLWPSMNMPHAVDIDKVGLVN